MASHSLVDVISSSQSCPKKARDLYEKLPTAHVALFESSQQGWSITKSCQSEFVLFATFFFRKPHQKKWICDQLLNVSVKNKGCDPRDP